MTEFKTAFLLLDFNRPEESELCLYSIKKFAKFPYKLYYLANGNFKPYAKSYKKLGYIDELIESEKNIGCGPGTRLLYETCKEPYAFYIQVDQYLGRELTEERVNHWIDILEGRIEQYKNVKWIDLAGNQGHGVYSERANFINVDFYNSIKGSWGGPGETADQLWREEVVQNYTKKYNYQFISYNYFVDNGKVSIRQNPDGSVWSHYTDEKKLFLLKGPVKEKYVYPKLSDKEWKEVLKTQKWEDGKIPEKEKDHSFIVWSDTIKLSHFVK